MPITSVPPPTCVCYRWDLGPRPAALCTRHPGEDSQCALPGAVKEKGLRPREEAYGFQIAEQLVDVLMCMGLSVGVQVRTHPPPSLVSMEETTEASTREMV